MNINKTIAESKGLVISNKYHCPEGTICCIVNDIPSCMDYTKDPKLILEMDTELHKTGRWSLHFYDPNWVWVGPVWPYPEDSYRGHATCLAYIEEFVK